MSDDQGDILLTLDPETGKAPKRRIRDAQAAYTLFDGIKNDDRLAAWHRARIQGLVDGNPPKSSEQLKREGNEWESNVNWREAEAIIESNAAAIWELDMEVPSLINVETDYVDPQRPGINYAGIVEQEYDRTVRAWPDYFTNRMLCTKEMLVTGLGPMFWPDKWDWRPKSVKRASLLIPTDSKVMITELELIGWRHTYQAYELYQLVKDEDAIKLSKEAGWSVDLIKDCIVKSAKIQQATNQESRYQTTTFESVQQSLKNNDIATAQVVCNPIRVIQFLCKEYSGKISRFMIYEDEQLSDYLYAGDEEYDDMQNAICLFMWNIGDGYYRSVKGLGHRIFPHVELSSRFINRMVDAAMMSSCLILQPAGSGATGQMDKLKMGGSVLRLPFGFNAIQQTFAPNLSQLIDVRTMMYQILNNNVGIYQQAMQGIDLPNRSATEVKIEEMRSAKLEKNQISIHYLYLDFLHKEIFRRLTNRGYPSEANGYSEAKDFQKRLKDRGVTPAILDTCRVTAKRAIGFGSAAMRDMVTDKIVALTNAGADEIGRLNAKRDKAAALVGYGMVDRYFPEADRDRIPTSETSLATLENNDISQGQAVVVGNDQPHKIHLDVHMPLLMQMATAFMKQPQQVNLQQMVPAMGVGLDHVTGHVKGLAMDESRKDEVKQYEETVSQLAKVFGLMQKALQAIMRQQQQQQQQAAQQVQQAQQVLADRDSQLKLAEIERNVQVKMQNAQMLNEARKQKNAQTMELMDMKTAADVRREDTIAAAGVKRDDALAAAEIRRKASEPKE